jgi:hypothetical protein
MKNRGCLATVNEWIDECYKLQRAYVLRRTRAEAHEPLQLRHKHYSSKRQHLITKSRRKIIEWHYGKSIKPIDTGIRP